MCIPQIEVNYTRAHSAIIRWQPATDLLDRSPGCLWNAIPGRRLEASHSYLLSADVDSGERLAAEQWRARGFGVALYTGDAADHPGTAFVDSHSENADFQIENLEGTLQRLTVRFTTDVRPPGGELRVVIAIAPADGDASGKTGDCYILRKVSLMISRSEEFKLAHEPSPVGNETPGDSPSLEPLRDPSKTVRLEAVADTVPNLPEPSTVFLLISALPAVLGRQRRNTRRSIAVRK